MRALLAIALAGCVTPSSTFTCEVATECPGGTCEADGFCSFPDADCPSGSSYGEGSGEQSNQCTAVTAVCGDGMMAGDEECDDENDDDTDFCIDCKLATCGDGHVLANLEECDEGTAADSATCNANCLACGAGSVTNPANNHCYFAVETPANWNNSAAACATRGAYLASIDDAAENAFVVALMTAGDYWIGLSDFNTNEFLWEDSFRLGTFTNWDTVNGEPSAGGNDDAVAIKAGGLWDSRDPNGNLPLLCERTPWAIDTMTHHAYLTLSGRGARQQHAGAVTACAALPGAPHLVSITDPAEQATVDAVTGATQAYIGLSDPTTEGTYIWDSGEAFSFFAWGTGEPTGATADTEDCVVLREDGTWADRDCDGFSITFVCELDPQP